MRKLDITKFYPSCTQKNLFQTFKDRFEMSPDVAYIFSKICTFEDYVPTGSPLSNVIAYYANEEAFNEINQLARAKGVKFTLYVDDLTFSSSKPISENFINNVKEILKKNQLITKKKKQKAYSASKFKLVTGVAITKDGKLTPQNKSMHKIHQIISQNSDLSKIDISDLQKLRGLLSSCRLICPNFMNQLYFKVNKLLTV